MAIKVLVSGSGKMGREVLTAAAREPDLDPVGVVDLFTVEEYIALPDSSNLIPYGKDPAAIIARTRPDVVVDFTNAEWTPRLARDALDAGVRMVIGTSGLPSDFIADLEQQCRKRGLGSVVASNFAIGAVLMQYLARIAGRFFDTAEIIEMHHDQKVDAPSGTAIATAQAMAEGRPLSFRAPETKRQNIAGTRGGNVDGVTIHSVRLPGLVAHHEVIFGASGETLTIRHDTFDRSSFMPGVVMATREVMNRNELVVGLDKLIGLT